MSLFDKDYYFEVEEEFTERTNEGLSCEWDNYMNEGFDIYSVDNCIVLQEIRLKKIAKLYDIKEELSVENMHDFSFQEDKATKDNQDVIKEEKNDGDSDDDNDNDNNNDKDKDKKFEDLNERLVNELEEVKGRLQDEIGNEISFDDEEFHSCPSNHPIINIANQAINEQEEEDDGDNNCMKYEKEKEKDHHPSGPFNSLTSTEKKKKIQNKLVGNIINPSPKFKGDTIDEKAKNEADSINKPSIPMIYNDINDDNDFIIHKHSISPSQSYQKESFEIHSLSNISLSFPGDGMIKKNAVEKDTKTQVGLYHHHQKNLKEFTNNSDEEKLMIKKKDSHLIDTSLLKIKQAYWFTVKDNVYYDYLIKNYKNQVSIAKEISVFFPKDTQCEMTNQSNAKNQCKEEGGDGNSKMMINKEEEELRKDNEIMKLNKQVNAYKSKNQLMKEENNELIEAISLLKKISSTIDKKDNINSFHELISPYNSELPTRDIHKDNKSINNKSQLNNTTPLIQDSLENIERRMLDLINNTKYSLPLQINPSKNINSRNTNNNNNKILNETDDINHFHQRSHYNNHIPFTDSKSITSTYNNNNSKYTVDYPSILQQKDKRKRVVKQLEEILFNIQAEERRDMNKTQILSDKGKEKESIKDSDKETFFKDSDRDKEEDKEINDTPSDNLSYIIIPYHLITQRKLYDNILKSIPVTKEDNNRPSSQRNTRSNSQKCTIKLK